MNVPAFLIIVALVLVLPVALAVGGHNGATAVGVILTVIAIVATVASSPSKESK